MPKRLASREKEILALVRLAIFWEPFVGPTGARLCRMQGRSGVTYTVSRTSCTCPADTYSPSPCKHRDALELYLTVVRAYRSHTGDREEEAPPTPEADPAQTNGGTP